MKEQFSVQEALSAGMTEGVLRRLDTPFRGARDVSTEPELEDPHERAQQTTLRACRAYLPVAPPHFAFSHLTACRIYGIPLPSRLSSESGVDVSVPRSAQPPRRSGVVGHRGLSVSRAVGGLPVVTPEIAWLQLAARVTADELIVAGDYLVRRKRPLSSLDLLRQAIIDGGRMRGVALARTAFGEVRGGTDSPPESRLRLVLTRGGLPEPLIGYEVHHEGAWVGTPDLAYVEEKIAIEYEGSQHRLDQRTYEEDIYRREMFERAGWYVYLVTAPRLRNPAAVVASVRTLLEGRRDRERS